MYGFWKTAATVILSVDQIIYYLDCFNTHLQTTKHRSACKLIAPFPQIKKYLNNNTNTNYTNNNNTNNTNTNNNYNNNNKFIMCTCQIDTTWLTTSVCITYLCVYRNLMGGQNYILNMHCCKASGSSVCPSKTHLRQ